MTTRGRDAGFVMGAEHRTKIGNSKILNRLIGHAEGTEEMTATQITAAIALLKKVMPDLSSQHLQHDMTSELAEFFKSVDGKGRGLPAREA